MPLQSRLAGIGAILGWLVGLVAGIMAGPPFLLQKLLENTLIDAAVFALALGTVACLFVWARQSADPDRMAFAVAIASLGVLVVIVNIIAPTIGWWAGPYFATRLIPLALLIGLEAGGFVGLILLGYRWLAARRPRLALTVYGVLALLLLVVTFVGDRVALESGRFTFEKGYQIWHDAVLGQILFLLPLLIYETLSRSWRSARLPPLAPS